MTTFKIEMPPELKWEEQDEIRYPADSLTFWGIKFHVDAIEVDDAGEAISVEGARMLRLLNEIDGGDEGHFTTIGLQPGRRFVVHFYPLRCYDGGKS
jgi:hypothetical protein